MVAMTHPCTESIMDNVPHIAVSDDPSLSTKKETFGGCLLNMSTTSNTWLEDREATYWAYFEQGLLCASSDRAVTMSGFQTELIGSKTVHQASRLDNLPAELKIVVMCHLDEPSLSALMRTYAAYNEVFLNYRSDVFNAVMLNTLHTRDLDLQLRMLSDWKEVSATMPRSHFGHIQYQYVCAIKEYQRQCLVGLPIRMSPQHCTALCSLQDVISWNINEEDDIQCYQRPAASANRLPLHTYEVLSMSDVAGIWDFFELLAEILPWEDPWFTNGQDHTRYGYHRSAGDWIRFLREEPSDRATMGRIRPGIGMEWLYHEGLEDAWKLLES